jgi:hypothetical protein
VIFDSNRVVPGKDCDSKKHLPVRLFDCIKTVPGQSNDRFAQCALCVNLALLGLFFCLRLYKKKQFNITAHPLCAS